MLTALEIAQGLKYLHHRDRRMVHRDLSTANVLLATAPGDERGFRALLSDFGGWGSSRARAAACCRHFKGTHTTMQRRTACLGMCSFLRCSAILAPQA